MSSLEERLASVANENQLLQEKVTLLTGEKTAVENEMALLQDSLKASEREKKVGYF